MMLREGDESPAVQHPMVRALTRTGAGLPDAGPGLKPGLAEPDQPDEPQSCSSPGKGSGTWWSEQEMDVTSQATRLEVSYLSRLQRHSI